MKYLLLALVGLGITAGHAFADQKRLYGSTRGWDVYQSRIGCEADHPNPQKLLWTLKTPPAGGWEMSLQDLTNAPDDSEYPASVTVDNTRFSDTFFVGEGNIYISLPLKLRLAMRSGNNISMEFDGRSYNYSLAGSTAVLLKLEECWHNLTGYDANVSSRRGTYAFK